MGGPFSNHITGGEVNAIAAQRAHEIARLHTEIAGYVKVGLEKAVQIGKLLTEQKTELAHGDWIPWIEANLPFQQRTAQYYMKVHARRGELKNASDAHLTLSMAYKLLEEPREEEPDPPPVEKAVTEYMNGSEPVKDVPDEVVDRIRSENDAEVDQLEKRIQNLEHKNANQADNIRGLQGEIEENQAKLKDLEGVAEARAEIKRIQDRIHQLQMKQTKAFEDAAGVDAITNALVQGRKFFTQQCMEIPALKVTPESLRVMGDDVAALVELVENWLAAIKQRFLGE